MTLSRVQAQQIERNTLHWLEDIVIGLNLCPFAKKELLKRAIRVHVSSANSAELLLQALSEEISLLDTHPNIETALLVHPRVLEDFLQYNDFLSDAERLIARLGKTNDYQLASFHPNYQFGGTQPNAAENYTNRSPYPMLHILREESVSAAIASHPDTNAIPERNIALMKTMGANKMQQLLEQSIQASSHSPKPQGR